METGNQNALSAGATVQGPELTPPGRRHFLRQDPTHLPTHPHWNLPTLDRQTNASPAPTPYSTGRRAEKGQVAGWEVLGAQGGGHFPEENGLRPPKATVKLVLSWLRLAHRRLCSPSRINSEEKPPWGHGSFTISPVVCRAMCLALSRVQGTPGS